MVKKAVVLMLLVSVFVSGTACGKKIAATVNGEPIYMEEVDKQLEQLGQQHQSLEGQQGEEYKKQFQKQILDDLIEQKLVLQEAEKEKIKVSDKEIDDWIKQAKQQFPSEQEFESKLKELNLTIEELKKNRKEQLLRQKMIEKITKDIKVTDKEVEDYYKKNKEELKEPEKVKIKWIILSEEKKAKEVLKELEEGADFAEVAKRESIDTATKESGGVLGLRSKNELPPEVAEEAFKIELNKLSELIKMQQGYAIIMVEEKQPEKQKTFDEAKEEIKNRLLSEKQSKAYQDWIEKVKKKAKIDKKV